MKAMVLEKKGQPLVLKDVPIPTPGKNEVLIKILACGVCRTDLHILEGDLPDPKLPLILGHEIVGTIAAAGSDVQNFAAGDRVGVPWLAWTCSTCKYCVEGKENLCERAKFTGYTVDGGFAEYCTAHAGYIFPISDNYSDLHAPPLLCAGLIGYRAYRKAGNAANYGFYGFGSSAHLLIQIAKSYGKKIFVFIKPGTSTSGEFAKSLGADWVGYSDERPPIPLDAAILFAPVGSLVPAALKAVDKGGIVVCAGIHMSDIPSFPYSYIWEERQIRSVANLTREDGRDFFKLVSKIQLDTKITAYPLHKANEALEAVRTGGVQGTAVIKIE